MSIYTPDKVTTTAGLPSSLTAQLRERLTGRVAASADATRVATAAPYTGGPLAEFPVSTPGDVEEASSGLVAPRPHGQPPRSVSAARCCCGSTTWSSHARTKAWT